jgi:adenine-specific DNA-methyltransferase
VTKLARINELINRVADSNPELAEDIKREYNAVSSRLAFGLNFERHTPEAVELPGRPVRRGDKVHILPPRGETVKTENKVIWVVESMDKSATPVVARIAREVSEKESLEESVSVDDLVVVAEFRDPIYPGLVSTGKVERGGDKPYHSVINAENFHALEALMFTHRGKVDAIYIDPPYNTGAKDWKYNNDYVESEDMYRHSKWLAFMERRLLLAKELLNPDDSVLVVAIDEKEYLRLGMLLEQSFPEARIQMVSSQINPAVVARKGAFGRSDEYLYFVCFGTATPERLKLGREWVTAKGRTHTGSVRWDMLRRSGTNAARSHSPGCFYPIYIDPNSGTIADVGEPIPPGVNEANSIPGLVPVLPIRKDGSQGVWQWATETFRSRQSQGRVKIGGNSEKGYVLSILKDGEYEKVVRGEFKQTGFAKDGSLEVELNQSDSVIAVPGTQWKLASHDSTQYGSRLLLEMMPNRRFPFPKSLFAVEDALRFFIASKPDALVVDFFSGSGTTAHALMRLNRQYGGNRISISVTNNEVSAEEQSDFRKSGLRPGDAEWEKWGICDYITKPRIEAAIVGKTPEGEPIQGDYKFTDEFPMSEGFEENVEFFTLTYESSLRVKSNLAFDRIAPLLWLRAGSRGRRIESVEKGWEVADSYGVLADLDKSDNFLSAIATNDGVTHAFIMTAEDRLFEAVSRELPPSVEPVRLYDSYIRNFEIDAMRVTR